MSGDARPSVTCTQSAASAQSFASAVMSGCTAEIHLPISGMSDMVPMTRFSMPSRRPTTDTGPATPDTEKRSGRSLPARRRASGANLIRGEAANSSGEGMSGTSGTAPLSL